MKKNIHPEYFDSTVTCGGCGYSFAVGATMQAINVSICSKCHPFYTGNQKIVDNAGMVDKFKNKYSKFLK